MAPPRGFINTQNYEQTIRLLVARSLGVNIGIIVSMGEIGSGSFDQVAEAIPLGRRAAGLQRDELRRYSLPEAEYRAWQGHAIRSTPRCA